MMSNEYPVSHDDHAHQDAPGTYEEDQRHRRPVEAIRQRTPENQPNAFNTGERRSLDVVITGAVSPASTGPLSERAGELSAATITGAAEAFIAAARKAAKAYEDDAVNFAKEVEDICIIIRNNAAETAASIEQKHATFRKAAEGMRDAFKCFPIINTRTNGGTDSK